MSKTTENVVIVQVEGSVYSHSIYWHYISEQIFYNRD